MACKETKIELAAGDRIIVQRPDGSQRPESIVINERSMIDVHCDGDSVHGAIVSEGYAAREELIRLIHQSVVVSKLIPLGEHGGH